jgi:two-component system chemotaxis sensor kinase CheA
LPLTLAIIDGVIVRVGNERFIIPTTSIKESLLCPEESYSEIAGRGETVLIRNKVIPLMRLDRIFEIEGGVKHPKDGTLMIVESDGKEAAVPVNEMLDKQEIVIKSLGEGLNKIKGLSGGAIMSDGRVGLIVDVPTLIQAFNKV